MLETFVDPARFHGTVNRAANWTCLGLTRGFRHISEGHSADAPSSELAFVLPVQNDTRTQFSHSILDPVYRTGAPKIMLTNEQMRTLPDFFSYIPAAHSQRQASPALRGVSIAAGACLCGTSRIPKQANLERILKVNRGHSTIENPCHYVIDPNLPCQDGACF